MKTRSCSLVMALAMLAFATLNSEFGAAMAQGTAFTYEGHLIFQGSPANGFYDFQFSLSNAPSGGSQIGGTYTNLAVVVSNGVFSTTLDFGAVFTGNPAWLAISVCSNGMGDYVGLAPLQPITPVPYAIFANTASNLSGTLPAIQLSGAVGNGQLANNAITINSGTGLGGGGPVPLGGSITLTNTGVISVTGNADISVSAVGGAVTLGDNGTAANTINTLVKRDAAGNFSAGAITANFAGNGVGLTNLNASQVTSGTLPLARLPVAVLTNTQSGVTLDGLTTVSNLAVKGTNYANYLIVTNAPPLNGSAIINLNASQLSNGTVALARLSGITSSQMDAATWQLATNVNGGNAALASNVVSGLILTNAFLTNALLTNSVFAGDGSGLFNLNASQLSSGTLALAQLPGEVLTNNQSGVTLNDLTMVSNLTVMATNFANYLVVSNAPTLDGSAITGLNASQLISGTVPLAQLSGITSNQLDAATWQLATNVNGGNAALASNVVSGLTLTNAFLTNSVLTNSIFAGDGGGLTNLNANNLSSGTLPLAQLPGVVITNNQAGVSLNGLTTVSNLTVTATNYANYLVVTNAPALNGSAITGLNASQLISGTVPLTQLGGITSNQLDATTWQLATNLNGGNAALASNVVSGLSLTNAFLTNAVITNSVFAGDGGGLTNLNASELGSGSLQLSQLPGALLTNGESGVTLNGLTTVSNLVVRATNYAAYLVVTNAPALNGSAITGLNASQLVSGTIALARLPGAVLTNNQSGLTTVSNLAVRATNFVNFLVVTNAPELNGSATTNLNASQLSSGTVPLARLSGITSNQLDAATWQLATNVNGGKAALASNVVSGISLTNAFLTNSLFGGNGSGLTNLNASSLVGVSTGNLSLSNSYGMTNVFDGDSYTRGDGSLPYTMPLGVQQMSGIPSVNFGVDGITTLGILINFQNSPWTWSQPNVIWAGNNDQYAFTPAANVVSNIGVMVADMALSNNTRYLVLSTINDYTNQGVGTPVYIYFTNLNALLKSTFTNHYVDIRAWMIQNYDPSSLADVYGLTNDSPPVSEWNVSVDHPNALGETLIANKVLESAYWLNNSTPLTLASVQEQIQNTLSQPVIFGNSITVGNISPPDYNPVTFTVPATGLSIYLDPYQQEIWTSFGALGFNGDDLDTIGALFANTVTADISGSTDGNGFPPLFSASAASNDGSDITNLNASQLAAGTVPTNTLPAPLAASFWHTNSPALTLATGANSVLTTTGGSVGFGGSEHNDYSGFIVLTNGDAVGTNITAGYAYCTNTFAYPFSVAPTIILMWSLQYGTAPVSIARATMGPTDIYAISTTTNFVIFTTGVGTRLEIGTSYCIAYQIPNNWQ